jgi:hypothetical protein
MKKDAAGYFFLAASSFFAIERQRLRVPLLSPSSGYSIFKDGVRKLRAPSISRSL